MVLELILALAVLVGLVWCWSLTYERRDLLPKSRTEALRRILSKNK
jgi:hypothetical protein